MEFSVGIARLFGALPKSTEEQVIGKQLLRSGTSVGAHYREATRARSTSEFISKIEGGLQGLEETAYWIELLAQSEILLPPVWPICRQEIHELTAVLVACAENARTKRQRLKEK